MRNRAGFTVIETVFAIFVFSVGALGFAATTALILRSLGESAARERAARIASARLETVRGSGCSAQSGSETREGIESAWTVSASANSVTVTDRVTYSAAGGARTDVYSAAFECTP